MAQIRLVMVVNNERPAKERWGSKDGSRPGRGYTVQAASSPIRRACRFCGSSSINHHPRFCDAPVRRGWGWPGWERNISRFTLRSIGRPSKAKHAAIAAFAAARSKTGVKRPKSTRSKRKRFLTSGGTPAKPQ